MVVIVLYLVVFGLPFLAGEHMFAAVAFTQLIQFATPIAAVQVDAVFAAAIVAFTKFVILATSSAVPIIGQKLCYCLVFLDCSLFCSAALNFSHITLAHHAIAGPFPRLGTQQL